MIRIYESDCKDFSKNGLGLLAPSVCTVSETLNGTWELTLEHPLDDTGKWQRLQEERIIVAPVPAAPTPRVGLVHQDNIGHYYKNEIYSINTKRDPLRLRSGPGNKGNLNLLYNVVRKGIPWPLGAFENRRSFTSIDNLCYVVEGLLTKEVGSGIYHMGDDEALSTNELIALMCRALDRKPHIWKINRGLMEFCARLGTLLHLPLNEERLRKLTENYVVSNAKIKAALEIDRMPVRAEEGIVRTIKSFSNIKVNN